MLSSFASAVSGLLMLLKEPESTIRLILSSSQDGLIKEQIIQHEGSLCLGLNWANPRKPPKVSMRCIHCHPHPLVWGTEMLTVANRDVSSPLTLCNFDCFSN